jgi:hypothetical protein
MVTLTSSAALEILIGLRRSLIKNFRGVNLGVISACNNFQFGAPIASLYIKKDIESYFR